MYNQQLVRNKQTQIRPIKILISSEFVIFTKGVSIIIEKQENLIVIGKVSGKNELFDFLKHELPDILIINFSLPPDSLNSLCRNINEKHSKLPVLIFLDCSDKITIPELIINGVRGIIWKENSNDDLIEAINKVAGGGLFFENPDNCRLFCHFSQKFHGDKRNVASTNKLSQRELQVLTLFTEGFSYRKIADALHISTRTVETHKENIQKKLNLHGIAEIVRYAIENDLTRK